MEFTPRLGRTRRGVRCFRLPITSSAYEGPNGRSRNERATPDLDRFELFICNQPIDAGSLDRQRLARFGDSNEDVFQLISPFGLSQTL